MRVPNPDWEDKGIISVHLKDPKTGETTDITAETIVKDRKKAELARRGIEQGELKHIGREVRGDTGKFIWAIYEIAAYPFIGEALSASNVTRLMFLSTFTDYKGALFYDNGTPITKSNLYTLLGLSQKMCRAFYKEAVALGYIKDEEGQLWIDRSVFYKGALSNRKAGTLYKQGKAVTKLYINGVRSLYRNVANTRYHKSLSYIFKIIPFVNCEYNVVCSNPLENDPNKINRLTLGDFSELVGLGREHSSHLCSLLFTPRFQTEDGDQYAVRYVVDCKLNKQHWGILINPLVYHAGTTWDHADILRIFKG